ncbi:MAG: DNA-processing protein DprA [Flavobacteriales bacterium]|nr:DNA-processing protein DprA [Flavobacteriales bacterium]
MHNDLYYQIALTLLPGIGPVKAKQLVSYCGSAENVFREKKKHLIKIPEIGHNTASLIDNKSVFQRAEQELVFIEKNDVQTFFITEKKYPDRLKHCEDSPILLYGKGRIELNVPMVVSIVGTRNATAYGKQVCQEIIQGIAHLKPLVISGLAYGIDICAHRNALLAKLPTVACVAHGLEKVYPPMHTSVALEMAAQGGLLTEFPHQTRMTPELFPMRNRIIAGLSDCTLVIETDTKGGSIITAQIANSYGRDVFAVPGRCYDKHSSGCNQLIRKNAAAILTGPQDLIDYMNWNSESKTTTKQLPLFHDLSEDETAVINLLHIEGKTDIDMLNHASGIQFTKLSNILLELEFKGVVKSLPGKLYELA